jgi:phosphomannomutase
VTLIKLISRIRSTIGGSADKGLTPPDIIKYSAAKGEVIINEEGLEVLELAKDKNLRFAGVNQLGKVSYNNTYISKPISKILALPLVDVEAIEAANFKVVADAVNPTYGLAVPLLLHALGVKYIPKINSGPHGDFQYDPEPLPYNLIELSAAVKQHNTGIAIDHDLDRLCFVCEDGPTFDEEYKLIAVADHVLKYAPGNTLFSMSSTRALRDVTQRAGMTYAALTLLYMLNYKSLLTLGLIRIYSF